MKNSDLETWSCILNHFAIFFFELRLFISPFSSSTFLFNTFFEAFVDFEAFLSSGVRGWWEFWTYSRCFSSIFTSSFFPIYFLNFLKLLLPSPDLTLVSLQVIFVKAFSSLGALFSFEHCRTFAFLFVLRSWWYTDSFSIIDVKEMLMNWLLLQRVLSWLRANDSSIMNPLTDSETGCLAWKV